MKKKAKRLISILLTLVMVLSLMPVMSLRAYAYDENPYTSLLVTTDENKDKSGDALEALQVTFNGMSWYIIGDNSTAVNAGTVTLLAAESFGTSAFANIYDGQISNAYSTSMIKGKLDEMTTGSGTFAGVVNAINTVNVKGADYDTEVSAKLYLLSVTEARDVPLNVRKIDDWWWLRSPGGGGYTYAAYVRSNGDVDDNGHGVFINDDTGVRPALKLNLAAVTFNSANNTFTPGAYINYFPNGSDDAEALAAKVVTFNNKDWYIIEDNSTAVNAGTVTLLAKDPIGSSKFDDSDYLSNDYGISTVKNVLDNMTKTDGSFANVANAIVGVDLIDVGTDVIGAKLWLLSVEEAGELPANVRNSSLNWWLRSPCNEEGCAAYVDGNSGSITYDDYNRVDLTKAVRPALKLNLAYVDFASNTFTVNKYCPGITSLGTGAMAPPSVPAIDKPWTGSYVYYGKYDGTNPTKYRVLDKASSDFGVTGGSLLLDCDSVLYDAKFDENTKIWADSDVKEGLNGTAFLTKEGNFTDVEKGAIVNSNAETHDIDANLGKPKRQYFPKYTALDQDKVFLLDFEDVLNVAYGYYPDCGFTEEGSSWTDHEVVNHKKNFNYWWLRSPDARDNNWIGNIDSYGRVNQTSANYTYGVSPAFNVSLSSVIFSSLVSGTLGQAGAEYKLTLKDPGLTIAAGVKQDTNDTSKYHISYDITDNSSSADPTQVSVVVTDGIWDNGWSEGATIRQYTKLDVASWNTSGTGTFTLDSSITGVWGTNYHVYVLTEDVNAGNATDYASEPLEIKLPSYGLKFDANGGSGLMASMNVCDNDMFTFPACDFTAPTGKTFDYWDMTGKVDEKFYSGDNTTITNACAIAGFVTVTAHWKEFPAASVTTPPTAKTLIYNGSAQELVTAGTVTGGTMQYVIGTNTTTAPTDGWSADIPTATAAGTYYVWYMVKGDDDHSDYYSTAPVSVTIKSSSGGGGGYNPTPPTPPKPPTPPTPVEKYTTPSASENSIKVSAEIKEGTATLGEIKAEDIKKITDALGDKSENATLLIDLSGAKSEVNSLVLSTATMEVLAKAIEGNENLESVTIKLSNAEVVIDGLALAEIAKQAKGDSIKLVVEEAKDLSTAQKEALSDYDAVSVFSVYFESDGTMIHDFNGGTVILSVKFEPEDGRDPKHYHIYYLSGLGDMTRHLTRWIKGFLQFLTGHCSDFVIVYDEKLENETSKGDDWTETEYLPNGVTKDEDGSYSFYDPDLGTVPLSEKVLTGGLVHRMYNPNSGEHFYTVSDEERDILISAGWIYESEDGFTGPAASEDTFPVYRLYNPNGNDHHFTLDRGEAIGLKEAGWIYEGVVFYAYDSRNGIPVYRVYNPNSGHHFFTADKKELDFLVTLGWIYEGIAWYAVSDSI